MSIAILKEITYAEEQANQLEEQAQLKARETVSAARKDAAALIGKALEQAEAEAREIMKAAEEKARLEVGKINAATQQRCNEIREKAVNKLPDAVDFIIGRIVKS